MGRCRRALRTLLLLALLAFTFTSAVADDDNGDDDGPTKKAAKPTAFGAAASGDVASLRSLLDSGEPADGRDEARARGAAAAPALVLTHTHSHTHRPIAGLDRAAARLPRRPR